MSGERNGTQPKPKPFGNKHRDKDGRFTLETWRDKEQLNESLLASGYRITAREMELVDALIYCNGSRRDAGRICGVTYHMVELAVRRFCQKLGLPGPRGLQAMLYRAKMLGALEALNGMRNPRGYPIRDLYEASIQLGPDHPLWELLNPPRLRDNKPIKDRTMTSMERKR